MYFGIHLDSRLKVEKLKQGRWVILWLAVDLKECQMEHF